MKATVIPKPSGNMEVTLQVTMTYEEMKELKNQLSNKWPSWQFANTLWSLLNQLEKTYEEEIVSKE